MSRSWLKLIGTTERPCPECYESCHADSRRRMHRIRPGDRMVLYAVGRGKRVFALATVSRAAYDSGRADWPYRVDLSYEVNLPVAAGVSIDEVSTAARDLVRPIQRGASYIELTPEEFERAAARLRQAAGDAEAAPNHPLQQTGGA
jgi:hypothetical protein